MPPFLSLHAPNGQTWAEYCAPTPPTVSGGNVIGAWAEAMYASVVYELTHPGWGDEPQYADNGPAGYVIDFCRDCGYETFCDHLERCEEAYQKELDISNTEAGSRAFLELKARNGQTWEEYLRMSEPHVAQNGLVDGAWGECITAAVIFEHENPAWDQLGPFRTDGPAGQVIAFMEELGHDPFVEKLSQTEDATHQAVEDGRRVPVFDDTAYRPPVGLNNQSIGGRDPRPSGRKRALLIGCNYPGSSAQLSGCVNDVQRWHDELVDNHGFPDEQVLVLHDEDGDRNKQPTRANWLNAIRWLVAGAESGDALFFQFSGHGGQKTCQDESEEDGMDEVLIPTDYEDAGTILDHELFDLLVVPLPSGCKLTVVLDCCHSGSALDLPFTWSPGWQCDTFPWHTEGDVQMFSGCEDAQCSMDATRHGQPGGAMTTAMVDVMEGQRGRSMRYPELLDELTACLESRNFDQRPKLTTSQPFEVDGKEFSFTTGMVANMNPQLGQSQGPSPKPQRHNLGGFAW